MKGFQRAVGCLLAVGFLGQMPTPVIAAETPTVIEMPYASSLTAKDGSIRVVLQDSRKVHVTIQKMTQEGSDTYYDVVLDPTQSSAATTEYVFYLDCCEYNLSTASYVSTYQLTIARRKRFILKQTLRFLTRIFLIQSTPLVIGMRLPCWKERPAA